MSMTTDTNELFAKLGDAANNQSVKLMVQGITQITRGLGRADDQVVARAVSVAISINGLKSAQHRVELLAKPVIVDKLQAVRQLLKMALADLDELMPSN